jgi:hypothetical protein
MTAPVKLTPAQQRALEWLPGDGGWRTGAGRLTAALWSLRWSVRGWGKCCEREWGRYGANGGKGYRWRLTAAGLALRASRQPHQTPPEPPNPLGGTGQPSDASGASGGAVRAGKGGGR